jgi:uncharacterized protein (UPF0332 family)
LEAQAYLTKAENSLKAAQLCFENGLYDDAVSRAYYCVLRASIALLIKIGQKTNFKRVHLWVQAVFPRECVHRRKIVPKYLASYISDLQNDRNTADYDPTFISRRTAERTLKKADTFLNYILKEFENDKERENPKGD